MRRDVPKIKMDLKGNLIGLTGKSLAELVVGEELSKKGNSDVIVNSRKNKNFNKKINVIIVIVKYPT